MHASFPALTAAVLLVVSTAAAIPPPRLAPLFRVGRQEPDLLSANERRILKLEMHTLMRTINRARSEAAQAPELAEARQIRDAALATRDPRQITDARRTFANAVETRLHEQEEMPGKIRRLREVGRLLEYDSQRNKDQRRRQGSRPSPVRTM